MNNNRPNDQKRSSLDFSESSSDNDDPRRESYLNKDRLAESYDSQENPYSPDVNSMEDSYKPTPKSILKDNISALKGSKNIHINETLNETHPISQKNANSNLSPEQNDSSYNKRSDYQDYARDSKYRSGDSSQSSKSGEDQSPGKYGSSDDDGGYEAKLGSKYAQDDYGKGVSGFKNRLVVGQGGTDFQRAHVRKLQQEREQELSSKGVRESADAVREKWQAEKARRSVDAEDVKDERLDKGEYGRREGERDRLERIDEEDRSREEKKGRTSGGRESDTSSRFEKIKGKVANLEKELNSYSKEMKKSALKQEDRNQDLDRVYGDFEERIKEAKEELDQSLKGKRREAEENERGYNSRGFSADRSRKEKTGEFQNKSGTKKVKRTSSVTRGSKKEKKGIDTGIQKGASTTFKRLQEEISKLQYQNELLRGRLGEGEDEERKKRKTAQKGPDVDREKELIDTIDRIKGKLRKSIVKKMQDEKEQEIFEVQEEAAAKSFGRNYQAPAVDYKNMLMRKTYGDTTLSNKENSLYKGRGSTISGTSYSQKLNRSKR